MAIPLGAHLQDAAVSVVSLLMSLNTEQPWREDCLKLTPHLGEP